MNSALSTNHITDESHNTLTSPVLMVSELKHEYPVGQSTRAVLNNINLELRAGEIVALLGRSGSGKSTLLNLLSGLEAIQQGEITLFGQRMRGLSDRHRTLLRRERIGFVYQAFNLVPTLTVAENILLPLALNRVPPEQQSQRLNDMLEKIGLSDRGSDYPDKLSGGEQQRVALARAIIHNPPLLLADEPTGNLDAQTGRHVLNLLETLVAQRHCALLLVTHSDEVAELADRVLTIQDGSLVSGSVTQPSAW